MLNRYLAFSMLAAVVLVSACAPSARVTRAPEIETIDELPPVPERKGPLDIELVYPRAGARKPAADSTFLFGSVGTGEAGLTINDIPIAVAPNGAFLAFVPVPEDGSYTFVARADGEQDRFVFSYAEPPPAVTPVEPFDAPLAAVVVGGRDTLATGSQIVHAYPSPDPGADRKWFFPPGTELVATGRSRGLIRVRLTDETDAWIDSSSVQFVEATGPAAPAETVEGITISDHPRYVDVKLGAGRAPFLVIPDVFSLGIVSYGVSGADAAPPGTGFVREASLRGRSPDSTYLHLDLSQPLWGFKAFFDEEGALVVRVRKPPAVSAADPLDGLRVMVDPGHPPGGAIGPTGYTEAEANLEISRKLADMLRERGAEVVLTRTGPSGLVSDSLAAIELWSRVDLAVEEDVDLLVSVHNNAFADGVNPFENFGTEMYYYHPFSEPLAEALQEHIVAVTGLPDLGAKQRSLALVRPSWMPSTLTESLFMMFPQQEAALRHDGFQERLARAHLEGIEAYLRRILDTPAP